MAFSFTYCTGIFNSGWHRARGEDKFPIVVSEAVVWEGREAVYNSSSSLLLSPFTMSDNYLKSEGPLDFRSAEASWSDTFMCWVGFDWGETFLLLVLTWGALGTPGIPLSSSSSSSGLWRSSTSCPPICLVLPCRGNSRFLCRTLVLPLATLSTLYTEIPGLGCPINWYSSLSHLSCIFMFAFPGNFPD